MVKVPLTGLFIALIVTCVAAAAAPAPAPAPAPKGTPPPKLTRRQQQQRENFKHSAPADEYFGRGKISYLGMNNTFRDAAISSGDHTTDSAIVNKVALAEDALDAWAKTYPSDPQLARTYFLATRVERKIWIKANQDRAWIYLNRLVHDFPATYFGKFLKRDLAIGFTEHYYAPAQPCATPAPTASPSVDPSAPADADTPAPETTATPAPTPSPGPTETTLTKGLRVQIIPQPCVPVPTPTPTPSPTPTASPTASPSPDPT
jgi:hypothetical protein